MVHDKNKVAQSFKIFVLLHCFLESVSLFKFFNLFGIISEFRLTPS